MQTDSRYARQLQLSEIGIEGQAKLAAARVLLLGVGGLGCTVATQLVSAGVGELVLVDHDTIDQTNLHRQHLFRESDCGQSKAKVAQQALRELNSSVNITAFSERILPSNIARIGQGVDLIIDAADNFAVTYLACDFSRHSNTPMLSASVNRVYGHVGVFGGPWPSFRAVFPRLPANQQSCDSVGVTGPSVGVIASLQAQEALKILVGQTTLGGKLLYVDCWHYNFHLLDVSNANEDAALNISLVEPDQLSESDYVIDVRNTAEVQTSPQPFHVDCYIPLDELSQLDISGINQRIVLACRSGQRAMLGAQTLKQRGATNIAALLPTI
ncbi:ThiF family adenylyltransferase [Arenicella xantha]|uniref:Molybdopterin/thiamine biosynthesis adenylyltransferase n=1 Tax=Arenicella xantha TaxID=644221 RepID=A0A395JVN8_9GAMM|nr:ThiF family adenylyltransferase [Arenicella xantha]RBP53638.1 molybdopterin/thiamine biosynthesis adenylyltransferase [Arenicella xantha]